MRQFGAVKTVSLRENVSPREYLYYVTKEVSTEGRECLLLRGIPQSRLYSGFKSHLSIKLLYIFNQL